MNLMFPEDIFELNGSYALKQFIYPNILEARRLLCRIEQLFHEQDSLRSPLCVEDLNNSIEKVRFFVDQLSHQLKCLK